MFLKDTSDEKEGTTLSSKTSEEQGGASNSETKVLVQNRQNTINRALVKEFLDNEKEEEMNSASYFPDSEVYKVAKTPNANEPQFLVNEIFKNTESTPTDLHPNPPPAASLTPFSSTFDISTNQFFKFNSVKNTNSHT